MRRIKRDLEIGCLSTCERTPASWGFRKRQRTPALQDASRCTQTHKSPKVLECGSPLPLCFRTFVDLTFASLRRRLQFRGVGSVLISALLVGQAYCRAETPESAAVKLGKLQIHVQYPVDSNAPQVLQLRGADARQQILVTGISDSGAEVDCTRKATFTVAPNGIVRIDGTGLVTPLGDGAATITAKAAEGLTADLKVKVEKFKKTQPVNFPNQIVPIFTKAGCNGGGCHGKSGGQNGFRLSLLGFEPSEDYEHLVKEARGRRLFPAAPDYSLLLMKAVASLPHGGD